MSYSFPKIEISEPDRMWLSDVYSKFKKRQKVTHRALKVELFGKIPADFNPYAIDRRLYLGDRLTLLGMLHVDPNTEFVKITDSVITAIKDMLFHNPELREITAEEVAGKISTDIQSVTIALRLMTELGRFASTLYGGSDFGGLPKIGIDGDDVFDEYLQYAGIEKLILDFYSRESQKIRNNDSFSSLFHQTPVYENKSHPIFHTVIDHVDPKLCFVLMPFNEEWSNRVYKELIRENVEKLGFQCLRADNLKGPIIIEDIWTKINQSAIIIADVTTKNPNVMYEMGIVHAIGKPAILLTQRLTDIPFDFAHLRHYEYKDNSEGFRDFSSKFSDLFTDVYKVHYGKMWGV